MEMQKATGGAEVASSAKVQDQNGSAKPSQAQSGSVKNNKSSAGKTATCSKRARKMAALKAKAVPDDKENVAPEIWKPTSSTNPASELKKSPEKPQKIMLMPAGESSDEEKDDVRKDENPSEDSFDYVQTLVEKEKKTRNKREKAKDRKKGQPSK